MMSKETAVIITRGIVTVLLSGMYIWLLYIERDIPRVVEGLRVVAIGVALIGTDPVVTFLSKVVEKWTK